MDGMQVAYSFGVLLFVIGGIWGLSLVLRIYGERLGFAPPLVRNKEQKKRLRLEAHLMLDAKRKLVVVSDMDQEYVLLLGPAGDEVIAVRDRLESGDDA